MPRHSKVYNALFEFYRNSIDQLCKNLESAYDNRLKDNDKFESTRLLLPGEIGDIIHLAKNQAIHFNKKVSMISDWEKDFLISETISYGDKSIRRMKSKRILSASKEIEGIEELWDEVNLFA